MNRIKTYLPSETLKTIYYSLIHCHLHRGVTLWGWKPNFIETLQRKAIRIISKAKYNAHAEPIFKHLGILKLQDIQKTEEWKFYYNLINKSIPKYFHPKDKIDKIQKSDVVYHIQCSNTDCRDTYIGETSQPLKKKETTTA